MAFLREQFTCNPSTHQTSLGSQWPLRACWSACRTQFAFWRGHPPFASPTSNPPGDFRPGFRIQNWGENALLAAVATLRSRSCFCWIQWNKCIFFSTPSSSVWILSIFFPNTSTQDGNTLIGVVLDVTVGKASLGSGRVCNHMCWKTWSYSSVLLLEQLEYSLNLRTQLERQNPTGIGGLWAALVRRSLSVGSGSRNQLCVGAADIRQVGVKQSARFILAGGKQLT